MNSNKTNETQAHVEASYIFKEILPTYKMPLRTQQLELCQQMISSLFGNKIALCDAGVGIGKTYAYLIAIIIWKKHSANNKKPVAISTASVALQNALIIEYIPFLSKILNANNIIDYPINAVICKGKRRFVCDELLNKRLKVAHMNKFNDKQRLSLLELQETYDLDDVNGLKPFNRNIVSVPKHCPKNCVKKGDCRYHRHLKSIMLENVSLQICNHNYLLADAIHKHQEMHPLLNDYSALIIDEAHKLPEVAQQIYSTTINMQTFKEICTLLEQEKFTLIAQSLMQCAELFFGTLKEELIVDEHLSDIAYTNTKSNNKALKSVIKIINQIIKKQKNNMPNWLYNKLYDINKTLELFLQHNKLHILYITIDSKKELTLYATKRNIPWQLENILWNNKIPTILTSGTLQASVNLSNVTKNGSFARIRKQTGLVENNRVQEFHAESPFDYYNHCLIYFPKVDNYIAHNSDVENSYITKQIIALIKATHGHTLILFTSYSQMEKVYSQLKDKISLPLLQMHKNNLMIIAEFKKLENAVLFSAGSCWEGVDFAGDCVSSLIIPRLPFPVPNPVSESERKTYKSLSEYLKEVIVPDMQKKLRQGFGRAIRTETDTCVISILDKRAGPSGRYYNQTISALPACKTTDSIEDVAEFIKVTKDKSYFK